MVDLLKVKGKLEINSIASELGIGPITIENWSRILEKGGIVEITYEMGKMYVSILQMSVKEKEDLKNKVQLGQKTVTTLVESKTEELHLLAQNLDDLKIIVQKANRLYTEKLPNIQAKLTEINNVYVHVEHDKNVVIEIKENIEKTFNASEKQITDLVEKTKYLESDERIQKINTAIASLKDLSGKSKEYNDFITNLNKNREKAIAEMKSDIDRKSKQLKEELDKQSKELVDQLHAHAEESKRYNESILEQTKISNDLSKRFSEFMKQKDLMVKNMNKAFADFKDKYARSYSSVTKNMDLLNAHSDQLKASIKEVKDSFGSASTIFDFISDIEASVKKTDENIAAMRTQIENIKKEFNTFRNDKTKTLTEKDIMLVKMTEELGDIEKEITSSKEAIDKNLKDILSNNVKIKIQEKEASQSSQPLQQNPQSAQDPKLPGNAPQQNASLYQQNTNYTNNTNNSAPNNIPTQSNQDPLQGQMGSNSGQKL